MISAEHMKELIRKLDDYDFTQRDVLNMAYQQGKLDAYKNRENADGCKGCAFKTSCESWELPCAKCKRNCKDYWRGEAE